MSIAKLNVEIGAEIKSLEAGIRRAERALKSAGDNFNAISNRMSFALSAPLVAFGAMTVKTAGQMESLRLAMETTMKDAGYSVEQARTEVEKLRQAAMAPGLDFEQAVRGSVRLQNVGFSAEKAREILIQLGNAVAMSGGSAQELDGVTKQFGQMIAKGRVLQEDLSIIQENMPAVSKAMEEAFGTKSAEKLRAMGVDAEQFVDGVIKQLGKLERVPGGISNAIVNAGSAIKNAAANIGESLNKAFNISGLLDQFAASLSKGVQAFTSMDAGSQRMAIGVAVFAAALGPALKLVTLTFQGVGALYLGFQRLQVALKTIQGVGIVEWFGRLNMVTKMNVLAGVATAVIALTAAFAALRTQTTAQTEAQRIFAESNTEITKEIGAETAALTTNMRVLMDSTASMNDRRRAVEALQKAYPNYLQGLDLESASIERLKIIQHQLTLEITRSIIERKKSMVVEAQMSKVVEAQMRIMQLRQGGFESLSGEEVKRTGRSLFGTDFEKSFVGAEFRTKTVNEAINLLEQDMNKARQTADDLSKSFDQTFSALSAQDGSAMRRDINDPDQAVKLGRKPDAPASGGGSVVNAQARAEAKAMADARAKAMAEMQKDRGLGALPQIPGGADPLGLQVLQQNKDPFAALKVSAQAAISPMAALQQQLDLIAAKGSLFSTSQQVIAEQMEATKQAMLSAVTDGYDPLGNTVLALREKYEGLRAKMEEGQAQMMQFQLAGNVITAVGDAIAASFQQTELSLRGFVSSILTAVAKVIGAQVKMAIASYAAKALATAPHPVIGLALAAAGGAIVEGMITGLMARIVPPKLAKGGLAFGQTMAMVGDNPGAHVDPEVIAPLSTLKNMLHEQSNGNFQHVIRIDGEQLLILLKTAEKRRNRYGG